MKVSSVPNGNYIFVSIIASFYHSTSLICEVSTQILRPMFWFIPSLQAAPEKNVLKSKQLDNPTGRVLLLEFIPILWWCICREQVRYCIKIYVLNDLQRNITVITRKANRQKYFEYLLSVSQCNIIGFFSILSESLDFIGL